MSKILALLLSFAAVPLALAQETTPSPKATPAPEPILSIRFPGGTLKDLIAVIRQVDPSVNIIGSVLTEEVRMPEMSIKGATVMATLETAASVAPPDYRILCRATAGPGAPVYSVAVQFQQLAGQPAAGPRREAREVRVFSLRSLIEPQPGDGAGTPIALTVETVLSALEAGTGMGSGHEVALKYHRDSMLLFVDGSANQINIVREVLQNLMNDQKQARDLRDMARAREEVEKQRAKAEAAERGAATPQDRR